MQCIHAGIGILCHLYEGLCLPLSWLFLHVIHCGLLVHRLVDLDGSAELEGCLKGFHWLVDIWSCQNGIRLLWCLFTGLNTNSPFFYTHFYIYALQLDWFNFLLQSTLHHANKPRNTGNEPCKQSQINSIMSHLHHASALESKTKVFVTLRKKKEWNTYSLSQALTLTLTVTRCPNH